jgi:hypothetical protein
MREWTTESAAQPSFQQSNSSTDACITRELAWSAFQVENFFVSTRLASA